MAKKIFYHVTRFSYKPGDLIYPSTPKGQLIDYNGKPIAPNTWIFLTEDKEVHYTICDLIKNMKNRKSRIKYKKKLLSILKTYYESGTFNSEDDRFTYEMMPWWIYYRVRNAESFEEVKKIVNRAYRNRTWRLYKVKTTGKVIKTNLYNEWITDKPVIVLESYDLPYNNMAYSSTHAEKQIKRLNRLHNREQKIGLAFKKLTFDLLFSRDAGVMESIEKLYEIYEELGKEGFEKKYGNSLINYYRKQFSKIYDLIVKYTDPDSESYNQRAAYFIKRGLGQYIDFIKMYGGGGHDK